MEFIRGRFSWILRPVLIIYDLLVVNVAAYLLLNLNNQGLYFFDSDFLNNKNLLFLVYSITLWLLSSYLLKFYKVYRYTSLLKLLSLIIKQFIAFAIIIFAFVGVFRSVDLEAFVTLKYLLHVFLFIGGIKLLSYYTLKSIRVYFKGNLRNIMVIGSGEPVVELKKIFTKQKELGYNIIGVFNNSGGEESKGNINDSFNLLENNDYVDEIYCAIDELSEKEINEYVRLANLKHCNIKFIPNTNKLFTKRLKTDYYNYIPVLTIQGVALNDDINKAIKRLFDIIFSLLVIVLVLSWLSVILFILIKLESKGPLFYKHQRTGINYRVFNCYKFRSMKITEEIEGTYVKESDSRVTKIGKFLRKTSLDELPQFVNVLLGDMSVVGPRPHMLSYTEDYSKKINKYNFIFRHNVKPGITGLAQIKGYRGEIKLDKDIVNRIKYDIFYIENWTLLLDIKIIIQTILNIIKGDEKAY
ncbi:exopolysaccharide biosynthesis polyprenyl glycosylphosphotransferase [bacterium]|nr:exopolysaccharide biosynthesis polyprenyl glycosylphosphotransferase [bacterium]